MLLFEHYIAPSPIHGLGCFSAVFIPKGTRIWEFNPIIDREISEAALGTLPQHTAKMIQTHAEYLPDQRLFRLASDGAFFMNHADDANFDDFGNEAFARCDISVGDEITCDYRIVKVWSFPVADTKTGLTSQPKD